MIKPFSMFGFKVWIIAYTLTGIFYILTNNGDIVSLAAFMFLSIPAIATTNIAFGIIAEQHLNPVKTMLSSLIAIPLAIISGSVIPVAGIMFLCGMGEVIKSMLPLLAGTVASVLLFTRPIIRRYGAYRAPADY